MVSRRESKDAGGSVCRMVDLGDVHPKNPRNLLSHCRGRTAQKLLKGLNQMGNVQNYVQHFRDLSLRIPSILQAAEFVPFMDGLKPTIRQQIAPMFPLWQRPRSWRPRWICMQARGCARQHEY